MFLIPNSVQVREDVDRRNKSYGHNSRDVSVTQKHTSGMTEEIGYNDQEKVV